MTIISELKNKVLFLLTKDGLTEGTYSIHELADEFGTTWQIIQMIFEEIAAFGYITLSIRGGGFARYVNKASIYSFADEGGFIASGSR